MAERNLHVTEWTNHQKSARVAENGLAPGPSVIDTYISYLRDVRRMSPNTVESYARDLGLLGAFAEQRGVQVDALERRDLEAFVRQIMSSGLAPRSVARAVACVRGLLPVRRSRAEASTAVRPTICVRRGPGPHCRSFCRSRKWIVCSRSPTPAPPRGLRDKALIEVLYATGLRVSELVALRAGDLNLDEGYLTCIGKGDKQRMVPLGHEAADWVRRYIRDGRPGCCGRRLTVAVRERAGRRTAVARRLLEGAQGIRRSEPASRAT